MDDKINVNKTNMNENLEHKKAVLSAFSAERGKIADKGQKYPWVALLGSQESKRKIYLEHAAKRLGLHVLFINWYARKFIDAGRYDLTSTRKPGGMLFGKTGWKSMGKMVF